MLDAFGRLKLYTRDGQFVRVQDQYHMKGSETVDS